MRKETGDPKWDYDPVDVTDFLISQFKEGDLVEALGRGQPALAQRPHKRDDEG